MASQWKTLVTSIVLAISLVACVEQQPKPAIAADLKMEHVSAVAVISPGFELRFGDRLGWREDIMVMRNEEKGDYKTGINDWKLKLLIEQQLQEKGFEVVAENESADYILFAAVILGGSDKGKEFEQLLQLYPSLRGVSDTFETGTLLMGLSRPGSPVVMWRAAIQTYIEQDSTPEEQDLRQQVVVKSLLRTMPVQ
ncbi:MAG: hypothetical protein WCY88_14220 [Spongiibacteraceae bacterium]